MSELVESDDLSLIESALDAVLDVGGEYLEAPEAAVAVAAAEAVARLQGNFGKRDAYSESLDTWVSEMALKPTEALAAKAHAVLARIVSEPSELLELWQEGEDGSEWLAAIEDLKSRIHG
ncbi:hypothetical protein ANRL3_02831 [Anaerolineae bacterium]|nr:hypothetical protein ANRL3_02831 [Anaerolineae bacterium]